MDGQPDPRKTDRDLELDRCRRWTGPPCDMCFHGITRMTPADGVARYVHCPACNGTGRQPW